MVRLHDKVKKNTLLAMNLDVKPGEDTEQKLKVFKQQKNAKNTIELIRQNFKKIKMAEAEKVKIEKKN